MKILYSFFSQCTECLSEFNVQFLVVLFFFNRSAHVADRIMFDKQNRCLAIFANLANTVKGTFVNLRISVATHIRHIVEDVHLSIDFSYQIEDFRFHLSVAGKTEIYDWMS